MPIPELTNAARLDFWDVQPKRFKVILVECLRPDVECAGNTNRGINPTKRGTSVFDALQFYAVRAAVGTEAPLAGMNNNASNTVKKRR